MKKKDNMSKEMKERLRKEYVGFGGAENKVRLGSRQGTEGRRARGRGGARARSRRCSAAVGGLAGGQREGQRRRGGGLGASVQARCGSGRPSAMGSAGRAPCALGLRRRRCPIRACTRVPLMPHTTPPHPPRPPPPTHPPPTPPQAMSNNYFLWIAVIVAVLAVMSKMIGAI
jgi:hypothetical protein